MLRSKREVVTAEVFATWSDEEKSTYILAQHTAVLHCFNKPDVEGTAPYIRESARLTRAGVPLARQIIWVLYKTDPFTGQDLRTLIEGRKANADWLILGEELETALARAARVVREERGARHQVYGALYAALSEPVDADQVRIAILFWGAYTVTPVRVVSEPTAAGTDSAPDSPAGSPALPAS